MTDPVPKDESIQSITLPEKEEMLARLHSVAEDSHITGLYERLLNSAGLQGMRRFQRVLYIGSSQR